MLFFADVMLSSDRLAQAIVVEHADTQHTITDAVAIGDTFTPRALERLPRTGVDFAVWKRLTLGASGTLSHLAGQDSTAWLVAPRIGWLARVGGRAAMWPRAGISYGAVDHDARTEVTIELPVGFYFTPTTAVTGTPAFDIPLASSGGARFLLTGGLMAQLDPIDPKPSPRFGTKGMIVVSADRLAPIVSFGKVTESDTPRGSERRTTLGPGEAYDASQVTRAGLAVDLFLPKNVTIGGSIGFGIVAYEHVTAGESKTDAHGATIGLSPRVGYVVNVGEHAAMWLRAGLSWADAIARYDRIGTARAYELALSLESILVLFPTPGLGITIGPSASITALADRGGAHAPLGEVGTRLAQIGATAGMLLAF
jgi:hypothetical protein